MPSIDTHYDKQYLYQDGTGTGYLDDFADIIVVTVGSLYRLGGTVYVTTYKIFRNRIIYAKVRYNILGPLEMSWTGI